LSVAAFQLSAALVWVTAPIVRPLGADGDVLSVVGAGAGAGVQALPVTLKGDEVALLPAASTAVTVKDEVAAHASVTLDVVPVVVPTLMPAL
jgi:hypothetical protein